jgi:hypothetical protein
LALQVGTFIPDAVDVAEVVVVADVKAVDNVVAADDFIANNVDPALSAVSAVIVAADVVEVVRSGSTPSLPTFRLDGNRGRAKVIPQAALYASSPLIRPR